MTKNARNGRDNVVRGLFRPPLLSRVLAALQTWHNRRVAVRQLRAMPDTLLRDIGIERYQIKDAVYSIGKRPDVIRMAGEKAAPEFDVQKAA